MGKFIFAFVVGVAAGAGLLGAAAYDLAAGIMIVEDTEPPRLR